MPRNFWREQFSLQAIVDPPIPAALANDRDLVFAAFFCVLAGVLGDRMHALEGDAFTWSALAAYAVLFVVARIAGRFGARLLERPAVAASIATTVLAVSGLCLPLIDLYGNPVFGESDPDYGFGILWVVAAPLCAIALLLSFRGWAPHAPWWRRLLAGVALPLAALAAQSRVEAWSSFYYYDEPVDAAEFDAEFDDDRGPAPAPIDYDTEDLLAIQDTLVDRRLATLRPQRPGQIDLYLIAVAGADREGVFRKESDFVVAFFDERFDTAGRSLTLVNHAETLAATPMATLRNLKRTLDGVGRVIDPAQDIVFLFLTSHGSENHDWAVELGQLPLRQIRPDDLVGALDNAGIRWRVAIVSACYSGGFVEALAGSTSLIVTAARADRTSFGCHAEAEFTYFGRAYFAEALQQTNDFVAAHAIASALIEKREAAEGFLASEPQISVGGLIAPQLAAWRDQHSTAGASPPADLR